MALLACGAVMCLILVGWFVHSIIFEEPPFDHSVWAKSDFLITGSDEFAVAIISDEPSRFRLRAKAEGNQCERAMQSARNAGTLVIVPDDQNLARYIFHKHSLGETISPQLSRQINMYWPVDRRRWREASFIMSDGGRFAIAMQSDGEESFRVLSKSRGDDVTTMLGIAADFGIRILQPDDLLLVSDVYGQADPGDRVGQALGQRIADIWPFDRRLWRRADFVLAESAQRAVAMSFTAPDHFYVLAKAAVSDAHTAITVSRAAKVPIIEPIEDSLTADIYRKTQISEQVEQDLAKSISHYWPVDRRLWRRADFVMVNPTDLAVGMKCEAPTEFSVLSKVEQPYAPLVVGLARESRIPLIGCDAQLTRRIFSQTTPGERVDPELGEQISQYWREYRFLPDATEFIGFKDVLYGKWRTGFLLGEDTTTFRIMDLASARAEDIPWSRVESNAIERTKGLDRLREMEHLDFLDYCVMNIAAALEPPRGRSSHVYVIVNPVKVDINAEEIVMSKMLDTSYSDNFFAFCTRALGKPYPHDPRKEPGRILRHFAESLQTEIQAKLSKWQVPMLEREQLAEVLRERGRAEEGFEFDHLVDQALLGGSHMVFAEIRHTHRSGTYNPQALAREGGYELSLRLVDLATGEVLWTDQLNRSRATDEETGDPQYFLDTGHLVVLDWKERPAAGLPPAHGWPLALSAISVGDTASHGAMVFPRLCYLEQNQGSALRIRDLFSKQVETLDAQNVKMKTVGRFREVPPEHQMRYLIWQMARKIMPIAGRVTDTAGSEAKVDLGSQAGLLNGTELKAVRAKSTTGMRLSMSDRLLPIRLVVTQAHQDTSLLFVQPSGKDALQVGDIVFPKRARPIAVAVTAPCFGVRDDELRAIMNRWTGAQRDRLLDASMNRSERLADTMRNAFSRLNVPVTAPAAVDSVLREERLSFTSGISESQAKQVGARLRVTHLVYGEVSPTMSLDPTRADERLFLRLKVLDMDSSRVDVIPVFSLAAKQIEYWQP